MIVLYHIHIFLRTEDIFMVKKHRICAGLMVLSIMFSILSMHVYILYVYERI